MGNRTSCRPSYTESQIKVLHINGSIRILKRPIKAGELVQQYPGYLLCHSEAFYIGKPIAALGSNEDLKIGHTYFLLPRRNFQSALTASAVAAFISKVAAASAREKALGRTQYDSCKRTSPSHFDAQPFKIQKKGNTLQVKISTDFLADLIEKGMALQDPILASGDSKKHLCDSRLLLDDYAKLVRSKSRPWKPKLSTIAEVDRHGRRFLSLRMLAVR